MAEDILGKTVRIDDKTYDPKGAKIEVWTKRRHKYVIHHLDKKGIQPSSLTYYYIDGDKISASLTDDEVIKAWLSQIETVEKKVYKVIQDPYSDEPVTKRVYGDGKSPYYLNNGCKLFIEWSGYIPNPKFDLGTFSTAEEAKKGTNNEPERFLRDQPITSNKDEVYNLPPFSKWIVPTGEVNAALQPVKDYRDHSSISSKKITIHLPDGFTENGGKGYLILTKNDELRYSTDSKAVEDTGKYSSTKDANIVSNMISKFKTMVKGLHGVDYDLKLCEPDSEACKLIEYKSPLEAPNNPPQQAAINDTPPGPSQSNTKIKLNIQGLFDSGDGTTPGSTSSVFEIKVKTDMPTFTIWTGEIPQTEEIDAFDDLEELDDEYKETDFQGDGENINTFEEVAYNVEEANSSTVTSTNLPPSGTPPQGSYVVANLEPDTSFDASQLPTAPGFNSVPLYFQFDNRWGNYNYGVGKKMTCSGKGAGTVATSGCMPSSLSMIINYWAKKGYCKPTRPDVVAQFCVDYGGRVCGKGGNLLLVPKDKFKEVFGLNIVAFSNIGDDKVRTLLRKGFPVNHGGATTGKTAKGASKSYGGHYLVMTGIDSQGRIRVNDSGNGPMGGKAITYYPSDSWSSANTNKTSQSYLYPDSLGDPLK